MTIGEFMSCGFPGWEKKCSCLLIAFLMLYLVSCGQSPKERQAKAESRTIARAVQSFRKEYGYNPIATNVSESAAKATPLTILMAITNSAVVSELNPGSVRFLDVPAYRIREGNYLDPWGRPYRIALAKKGTNKTKVGMIIVDVPVAVWSIGENGRDDAGKGDDISSWR